MSTIIEYQPDFETESNCSVSTQALSMRSNGKRKLKATPLKVELGVERVNTKVTKPVETPRTTKQLMEDSYHLMLKFF